MEMELKAVSIHQNMSEMRKYFGEIGIVCLSIQAHFTEILLNSEITKFRNWSKNKLLKGLFLLVCVWIIFIVLQDDF